MTASTLLVALSLGAVGSEVSVTANPPEILLGQDKRVALEIVLPVGAKLTSVVANVGTVSEARELGENRYEVFYEPPKPLFPQIGIVAATVQLSDGTPAIGWRIVPMRGRGVAAVKTKPRGLVSVRIKDETFGPIRADSAGVAKIPVEVPPGESFAFDGENAIDLRVPPVPHVLTVVSENTLRADAEESTSVWILASDRSGQPRSDASFTVEVSRGTVTNYVERSPGLYHLEWKLPVRTEGPDVVAARLQDEPAFTSTVEVQAVAGLPAVAELTPSRTIFRAGETEPVNVSVRVMDAGGNLCESAVELRADFGQLAAPTLMGRGVFQSTLTVPSVFGEARAVRLNVIVDDHPEVNATATLTLEPATATKLGVRTVSGDLVGDGATPIALEVRGQDRFGNDVSLPPPEVSADRGVVKTLTRDDRVVHQVQFVPPRSFFPDSALVSVSAAELQEAVPLELAPAPPRLVLGLKTGLLTSFNNVTGPSVAVDAGWWTTLWGQRLGLRMEVSYGASKASTALAAGSAVVSTDATAHLVGISLAPAWRRRFGERWVLSAEIGLGTTAFVSKVRVRGEPERVDGTLVPGVHGGLSGGIELWRGLLMGEIRGEWRNDPKLDTLDGSLGTLGIRVGYRLYLL